MPFDFSGVEDDTAVYSMFKAVTTPGFQIDPESLKQTSIVITSPNDGDIFSLGETVPIELSHLNPDRSVPYTIELLANNKPVATVGQKLQVNWQPEEPGAVVFEAVVKDASGEEMYRSPKMDIIVQPGK
jgi:hypothetical protein